MEPEFEINDSIMFKISNMWQSGVITTIFTNTTPIQYVVQTNKNEKIQLTKEQLRKSDEDLSQKISQKPCDHTYDINFQRILSQLILQKNEDQLIEELSLLKITPQQVIEAENGPKIIYTTYQFLVMRKPSIVRNYPFAPTNQVIKQLKKLILQIRKEVLKNCNFIQQLQKTERKSAPKSNTFKQLKERKLSRKSQTFWEDSEKEEQPTAFYENLVPSSSAFRPYKSDAMNHREESNFTTHTKPSPNTEQIKNIYFKPIIIQGPAIKLLC